MEEDKKQLNDLVKGLGDRFEFYEKISAKDLLQSLILINKIIQNEK